MSLKAENIYYAAFTEKFRPCPEKVNPDFK